MENITFKMHKNLFLKIKYLSGPWPTYVGNGLRTWAKACVHRYNPTYAARVSKVWKMQVLCNNG